MRLPGTSPHAREFSCHNCLYALLSPCRNGLQRPVLPTCLAPLRAYSTAFGEQSPRQRFETKSGWIPTSRGSQPSTTKLVLLPVDSHFRGNDGCEMVSAQKIGPWRGYNVG